MTRRKPPSVPQERSARCKSFTATSWTSARRRAALGLALKSQHSAFSVRRAQAAGSKLKQRFSRFVAHERNHSKTGGNGTPEPEPTSCASTVNSSVVASVAAQVPKTSAAAPLLVKIVQNPRARPDERKVPLD